jgi:hypothetical protein
VASLTVIPRVPRQRSMISVSIAGGRCAASSSPMERLGQELDLVEAGKLEAQRRRRRGVVRFVVAVIVNVLIDPLTGSLRAFVAHVIGSVALFLRRRPGHREPAARERSCARGVAGSWVSRYATFLAITPCWNSLSFCPTNLPSGGSMNAITSAAVTLSSA